MGIINIINEEINLLLENQMFRVYTQQYDDNFMNSGQPIYFSNSKDYWRTKDKYRYEAEITGNNIVNLIELQKELGRPFDEELDNYHIYDTFINSIRSKGSNDPMLEVILMDAHSKGGTELHNNVLSRLQNADLIIGKEANYEDVIAYVVMNPKNIKIINKVPNN